MKNSDKSILEFNFKALATLTGQGYIDESKRVTLANKQVKELKKELESIGYKF